METESFQAPNEQDEILKMSIDEMFRDLGEEWGLVKGDKD